MPGRMRGTAGAGDDHVKAVGGSLLGEMNGLIRRAVGGTTSTWKDIRLGQD